MAAQTGVSPVLQDSRNSDGEDRLRSHMEKLRARYRPQRAWIDKSVRSVSADKRHAPDGPDKTATQGCVDSLQNALKMVSQQTMLERLEALAGTLGLSYTTSGASGDHVFLSGEMFLVDIALDKAGGVRDVKLTHHGEPSQSCSELMEALSSGEFKTFSTHLEGLQKMYQVTGDKKAKSKAFLALQSLERDLNLLAQLQNSINGVANYIHKSPLGILLPRIGGIPMKLIYFVSPYDLLDKKSKSAHPMTVEAITEHRLGCSVTVGIESAAFTKLQTIPLMTVNKDPEGKSLPFFSPLTNLNSQLLPARFVLDLMEPIPMAISTANSIIGHTGVDMMEGLQKEPLLTLLLKYYSSGKMLDRNNLRVTLPDHKHTYFLRGVNGGSLEQAGVLVSRIPFTHPTHVPSILNALRQQLLFNNVIGSCIRPQALPEESDSVILDMTCLSMQQLSVACEHPCFPSMMVMEIDLSEVTNPKCSIATEDNNHSLCSEEYAAKVFQRCLSIPVTIRCILYKGREPLQRLYLEALTAKQQADEANQINLALRHPLSVNPSNLPSPLPPRSRPPSYPGVSHPALVSAGMNQGMGSGEGRGLLADLMASPPISAPDKINSNPLLAGLLDHDNCTGMSLSRSLSQENDVVVRGINRTMGGGNPPGMGMGGIGVPTSSMHSMGGMPMSMGSGGGMAMANSMPGASMCGIGMGGPNVSMGGPNLNMGGPNVTMGGPNLGVGGPNMGMGGAGMGMGGPGIGMVGINCSSGNLPPPTPTIDTTDSPMLSKLLEEHTPLGNTVPGAIPAPKGQHQQKKVRKRRSTSDILSGRSPKHRTSEGEILDRVPSVDLDSSSSPFEGGLPCGGSGSSGSSGVGGGPSVIDLTEDMMAGGLGGMGVSGGGTTESTLKKLAERVDSLIPPPLMGEGGRGGGGTSGIGGSTSELQALLADNSNSPQLTRASPVSKNENASTSLEELLAGSGEVGDAIKPDPGSSAATSGGSKSSKGRLSHARLPVDISLHNELLADGPEEKMTPSLGQISHSSSLDWGQEWGQVGMVSEGGRGSSVGKAPLRHSFSSESLGGGTISSTTSSSNRKDITGIFEKFEKSMEGVKSQTSTPPAPKNVRADCGDREMSKLKLKLPAAAFKGSMADSLTSSLASSQSASSFSSSSPASNTGRLATTPSSANTFDFKSDEEEDSPLFSFGGGLSVYSQSPTRLQISSKSKHSEVGAVLGRSDKRHRDLRSSGSESKHRRDKESSKKERKKRKMTSSSQYTAVKEPEYRAAAVEDHKSVSKIKLRLSKAPSGKTTIMPVKVKADRIEPPPTKKHRSSSPLVEKPLTKHDYKGEANKHAHKHDVHKHELSKHELKAELRHLKHEGRHEGKEDHHAKSESRHEMKEAMLGHRKSSSSSHKVLTPKALHKLSQQPKSASPQRGGLSHHGGRSSEMGRHKSEWSRTLSKSNDPKLVTKATIRLKPLNIPNSSSGSVNVSSKSGLNSSALGKSSANLAMTSGSTTLSLSSILPDAPSASSIASLPPIPRLSSSANKNNNSDAANSNSTTTSNSSSNNSSGNSGNSSGGNSAVSNSYGSSSMNAQPGQGGSTSSGAGDNRLKHGGHPPSSSTASSSTTSTSAANANSSASSNANQNSNNANSNSNNPAPQRSRKGSLSAIVDKLSKTCSTSVHVSSTPGGDGKSADKSGAAEGPRPRENKMARGDPRIERSMNPALRGEEGGERRASLDPRLARRTINANGPQRDYGKAGTAHGNYGNPARPPVNEPSRLPHLSAISKSRSVSDSGGPGMGMHRYNSLGVPRTASPHPRPPPPSSDIGDQESSSMHPDEPKSKVWNPWDRPERNSSPSLSAPSRPRPSSNPIPTSTSTPTSTSAPTSAPSVEKAAEVDWTESGGKEVTASPALLPPPPNESGAGGELEKSGDKVSPRGVTGRDSPAVRAPTPTAKFNGENTWDKVTAASAVVEEKKTQRSPTSKPMGENHDALEDVEPPVKRRKVASKVNYSPRSDASSPDNSLVIDCFSNGPSPKAGRPLSPSAEEEGGRGSPLGQREPSSPRPIPTQSPKVTAKPSPKVTSSSEPSPKVPPASSSPPKINSFPSPKVCQSPANPPHSGPKEASTPGLTPPGDNPSPCDIDDELMDEALMGVNS